MSDRANESHSAIADKFYSALADVQDALARLLAIEKISLLVVASEVGHGRYCKYRLNDPDGLDEDCNCTVGYHQRALKRALSAKTTVEVVSIAKSLHDQNARFMQDNE